MNSKEHRGLIQLAVLVGTVLLACGSALAQEVTYNFASGTDFAKYKTYKWVNIEGAEYPNQLLDGQIRQAIDSQLVAKGLTKVDTDNADIYVGYQTSITQEKQWNAYGMGGGPMGGWRMGGGTASATSSTLQVGTLGFDVYEPANKQLIWRGSATKTLNPSKNPEKNQKNLNNAIAKLLKNFPPPQKK
jgi:uncharacterized protein DUF4136